MTDQLTEIVPEDPTEGEAQGAREQDQSSGSYFTDYVKIAAFLAGALAYGPVLNAWLLTIGSRYYDVIMSEVGLGGNSLDLNEQAIAAKGYELLVQATNPFVSGIVVGLPFAFFAGLVLGGISAAFDIKRKKANLPRYDKTTLGGWLVTTGRAGLVSGSITFVLIALMIAVFLAPGLATDSANHVLNCAKQISKDECSPPYDYGDNAKNAHFLVSDKSSIYVYQDNTTHRLKLDDVSAIYSQARPNVGKKDSSTNPPLSQH